MYISPNVIIWGRAYPCLDWLVVHFVTVAANIALSKTSLWLIFLRTSCGQVKKTPMDYLKTWLGEKQMSFVKLKPYLFDGLFKEIRQKPKCFILNVHFFFFSEYSWGHNQGPPCHGQGATRDLGQELQAPQCGAHEDQQEEDQSEQVVRDPQGAIMCPHCMHPHWEHDQRCHNGKYLAWLYHHKFI